MAETGLPAGGWQVGWPVRAGLSAAVTVVFAAAILFGSDREPDAPEAWEAVAASEDWRAGSPPGEFTVVEVMGPAGVLLAGPGDLAGQVPLSRVPAGALVSKSMLGPPDADRAPNSALFRLGVDTSWWGSAGPAAGDVAVFATAFGECATAVAVLADADAGAGTVLVEADFALAAALAEASKLVVWEAPAEGWPACAAVEQGSARASGSG